MSIDYRKEVDNGFDRKRIIERIVTESLKAGIPVETVKKEEYYNFKHNEMIRNLEKSYNSKEEAILEIYNLYGIDPLNMEASDDYFKVSHPVGGELYPMTPQEEKEKFSLRDNYKEQIEELQKIDVEAVTEEYDKALDELIVYKQLNPVINQIIDCVDEIEIQEGQGKTLSLEDLSTIYIQMGLRPENLEEYNRIYNTYKVLEKNLDDITKKHNLLNDGKIDLKNQEIVRIQKLKNDVEKEILLRNTKLVNAFIRQTFRDLLVEADDLFQVCYLGLYKAIQNFDLSRNAKFSTYAYIMMHSEVHHNFKALTGLWWEQYWDKKYLEKQIQILSDELETKVTLKDLEAYGILSMSYDKAARLLNCNYMLPGYSETNKIKPSNPENYRDDIVFENEYNELDEYDETEDFPYDSINDNALKEQLDVVLGTLTQREEEVLRLRFGLDDGVERSLEEVGKVFDVTRERIRQIEAKALRKLRHPSRSRKVIDFLK